jgi:hypothetical protein
MAGYTHIEHIGGFIEIVSFCQPATGDGRTNHMAVGTVVVVSLDLVGGKLVKFIRSAQAAPHGHFSFLTRTVMEAGGEHISDLLVASGAFLIIVRGWTGKPVSRMRKGFVARISISIMASCASYTVMT